MLKFFILGLIALAASEPATFENYKVFRILPTTQLQINALREIQEYPAGYSFWKEPSHVNSSVDLMVPPEKLPEFFKIMDHIDTQYETYIENVQELVDNEKPLSRSAGFDFANYHTLEEIYDYLDKLAETFPDKVEVVVGGRTYEGRDIKGVKLSFGKQKPGVFLEGGIHAREWIGPATVLYLLNQFLHSNDSEVRALAESNDWYIFPVFNPDGYVYTHTTDRYWRKSVRPFGNGCKGVDLNRNFAFKWMQGGSSDRPCREDFAGTAPNSEIEVKTMTKYITSISHKLYAYIAFHSYSQLLLFPYGHTHQHLENYDELHAIGKDTITALAKKYRTYYEYGTVAETIYVATGSSMDWFKGVFQKPLAFAYELRDTGRYGFNLPPDQIIPTGEETLDSFIGMFKSAAKFGYPESQ